MGLVRWVAALVAASVMLAGCSDGAPQAKGDADATAVNGAGTVPGGSSGGPATGSSAPSTSNAPPPVVDVGDGKGSIDGTVADPAVRPLAGVVVLLTALNVSAVTNADGRFIFDGLAAGAYVLNLTHADHKPAQASVDVAAGKPATVKVTLEPLRDTSPRVEQQSATLVVSSSFCTPLDCRSVVSGSVEGVGADSKYFEVDGFPAWLQAEVTWDPTIAVLGDNGVLDCTLFGEDSAGDTQALGLEARGAAPLTVRLPGNWTDPDSGLEARVHAIDCELDSATGDVPVSVMANQQAQLFVTLFHNLDPDPDWTFIGDGAYPVPA